jgi:hypothetical protein
MAQARMLNKVIILSKKINAVSEGAENLYYRLLVNADDFGRFRAEAEIIKGQIYTLRKISVGQIASRLQELTEIDLIRLYKVDGETYLEITKFEDYQKFRSDIPKKSEYPAPVTYLERPDTSRNGTERAETGSPCEHNRNKNRNKNLLFNKNLKEWEGITEKDREGWKGAYPACNIDLELKKMIEWIISNPEKGKKSNWRRFITNWLTRQQDRGGTKGAIQEDKNKAARDGTLRQFRDGEITYEEIVEISKKYNDPLLLEEIEKIRGLKK